MEFKDKLKELRKNKDLTQDALAQSIHVSRSTIAKWEAGLGLPQQDSLEKLCELFEITKEELLSSSYTEENLVSKNIRIHNLNKRLFSLIITFSLVLIITIVISGLIISKIKYVNNQSDLYTTIQLTNFTDRNNNFVSTAGEIDRRDTLIKSEYGYANQKILFEKIKFTDKSSLILIQVLGSFTPGSVAYDNGDPSYKKNASLDESYIEIEFNDDVNPIYSWPNLNAEWVEVKSLYSENIVYDFSIGFSSIHLQEINNKWQFYYQQSFDDIVLSNDKKEIIREFEYKKDELLSTWKYRNFDKVKKITFHTYNYYLIEINDEESSSFEFSILTGMISGKHEIIRKQYIKCLL